MTDQKSNCYCGTGNVCPTHGVSDTPRMDEAIRKGGRKTPYNVATEAKNIERELAAMTAKLDYVVEQGDGLLSAVRRERDTLRARVAELEKGEYICRKCGLRKDGEGEKGDF